MKNIAILRAVTTVAAAVSLTGAEAGPLAAKIAEKHQVIVNDGFAGGDRTVFEFEGCRAWVVEPKAGTAVAEGRPWTWTMQWAEAFVPRTPVSKLLSRGWHHVTIHTFDHRMDEKGLAISKKFQDYLVGELGLAPKASLIGMSWGGFFSTRYAKAYPGSVGAIYYDCPLMNFQKGGYTDGRGEGPWCARVPADGWENSPEMPINMAGAIAAQDIPVYCIYGGADNVVPPAQNFEVFEPRYRRLGGTNLKVWKRGAYAHHPHGVEESDWRIAEFFLDSFKYVPQPKQPAFSVFAFALKRVMKDRDVDLKAAAKLLIEAGVTGFDTDYKDPMVFEYEAAGLKVSNLYGFLKFDTPDLGEAESTAFIDAAVRYGSPRVMVLPESFPEKADAAERERMTQRIIGGLRKMCAYAAKKGVIVMTEDFGDRKNICSFGPSLSRVLASVPELCYALDSGNFYYSQRGTEVAAFAKEWRNRIAHVHLKDQAREDSHSYRTLGEGAVPNAEVLKLVSSLGYCGWYTLENPVGKDYLEDIVRQRQYVLDHIVR